MDILDIDEALKDDSFICLEGKTHDDVSNILQQWKSNNCLLPSQFQQEQAYKLNSRTFTRPRRKSAQNLESHFTNATAVNSPQTPPQAQTPELHARGLQAQPMLNLEIGGLVTTMHKSFLQDTSPPASICSSMEASVERMNNSLITSADFTNINFLQSTQSLDFNDPFNAIGMGEVFNLANKSTSDGYTLSDLIRDRKALESLTLSGDGTLIKDSHIAQIDDISLAFSKTASGYSTMDNSTESMEENNRGALVMVDNKKTFGAGGDATNEGKTNIMHQTMLLSDEVISDTTFDLVESSLCSERVGVDEKQSPINSTQGVAETATPLANETFKKPWPMDETMCLPTKANTTFELAAQLTPDTRENNRCETPENIQNVTAGRKFFESTPQTTSTRPGKQQYTPSTLKLADDVNISPIVGSKDELQVTRVLNETFGQEHTANAHTKRNGKTFTGTLPRLESLELIEDMEGPNETFNKSVATTEQRLQQSAANIQMQNVLDLAHAEEELLASNNDQEFEDMLEEFSKVELNAEHMKMKKSLETIKRRFNRDPSAKLYPNNVCHNENQSGSSNEMGRDESQKSKESAEAICGSMRELSEQQRSYTKNSVNQSVCSAPSELQKRSLHSSKEQNECSSYGLTSASTSASASASASSAMNSTGGASSSSERLLNRRSRLYDNINLSALSAHSPSRSLGASYTVQKEERFNGGISASTVNETEQQKEDGKTEQASPEECAQTIANANANSNTGQTLYKLAEKRERDRDRFKTIKIVKERNAYDGMNVPCIDDDATCAINGDCGVESVETESNAHDKCAEEAVFNNNKSEINMQNAAQTKPSAKTNPNFLTYKKPKDKPSISSNLPDIAPPSNEESISFAERQETPAYTNEATARARSRSRPRYISGLQKLYVVKATSAGDLDRATALRPQHNSSSNTTLNAAKEQQSFAGVVPKYGRGGAQPLKTTDGELKSPLGTKSKSFHNLSSNFGFSAVTVGMSGLPAARALGLKKPATVSNDAITTVTQKEVSASASQLRMGNGSQQGSEDNVFKVPKLVSGIRAPGTKRAGLVRPSSGYYSLNLLTKGAGTLQTNDIDSDGGRHSPTDSTSSASSRGSLHNGGTNTIATANTNGKVSVVTASVAPPAAAVKTSLPSSLTKITTGATGIPKPSGLRPPSNVKRSGLPKPAANVVRR